MNEVVRACIGLGANLGDPVAAVRGALRALEAIPGCRVRAVSRLYRTRAWGRLDQPDFVNAAAVLETTLAPRALLEALLATERRAGRERGGEQAAQRWGPRVLDLDLLLYGERVLDEPGLRIPHPHLHERAFALVPLAEIAADAPFPGHGSVGDALRAVDPAGVEAIADA